MRWGLALGLSGLVYDPMAPAAMPKRAAILLMAVVVAASRHDGAPRRELSVAGWAFVGFVAWMALSLCWGADGSADLLGLVGAAALLLAALGLRDIQATTQLAALTIGVGSSLVVVVEWLSGAHGLRLHGAQGNPDWLGLVIAASLPCSLAWSQRRLGKVLVAVELVGLILARSRTASIAAVCALIYLHARDLPRAWRPWCVAVLISGGIVVVAIAGHAWSGRLWIWRISATVAMHQPWIGTGLGGFGTAFAESQGELLRALPLEESARRYVLTPSAHNDLLQALAEAGLPALTLLIVAGLAGFSLLRRRWTAGAATLIAIGVGALADSPLRQPAILMLLALVLGACPAPDSRRRSPAMALAALGLLLAVPSWIAEHLITRSRQEDPPTRAATLALAGRLDPRSSRVKFEEGLAALERHEAVLGLRFLDAARLSSWQLATDLARGNAWMLRDDPGRAAAAYRQALSLAPHSLRAHLNLAEAERRRGHLDDAEHALALARRLSPSAAAVKALQSRLADSRETDLPD